MSAMAQTSVTSVAEAAARLAEAACTRRVPAPSGGRFRAEINPLGEVTATFCEEESS